MLVLSALTQVTNRLEMCIKEAVGGQELVSLQWIEETYRSHELLLLECVLLGIAPVD